jgi:uncharacterized protein (TIRG00374 family)
VAIIAILAWRTRLWEAGDLLRGADLAPIILAIALNVVIIAAWAGRSRGLLARLGDHVGFGPLVPVVSFANTINGLTPASAGEVLRAVLLNRRHGVPYRDGAAVILLERVYALGLIAATALVCFLAVSASAILPVVATVAAVVLFAIPTVGYRRGLRFEAAVRRIAAPVLARSRRAERVVDAFADVEDRVALILASPGATLAFIGWSAAVFVTMDAQLLLVGSAIGVPIDPVVGWAALGLGAIAGVLSALPFGLGAADAVIAIVLIGHGMEAATATLVTILMRFVGTLPTGIIGTISYVYLNRTDPGAAASQDAAPRDETSQSGIGPGRTVAGGPGGR